MSDRPPPLPRGWVRHPREQMLMTPLLAGLGGMLAFFTVVFIVVWLPIHTFDPPASADWAPLSNDALKGRNLFASNGCYVCHSGYSRPQDVRAALYFLYPKVSQPGDFYGSDQSPNLLGTERTGPDLSQESGWHPDDWQRAHFYDPRFVDGKGPAATFMSPPPADFTSADDACCGGDTGPGDFYYRILHGWPGTAMENFGERLSVDDIWRVVLFVKTIPNHTLRPDVVPEPKDYIVWQPSKELLAWTKSHQTLL